MLVKLKDIQLERLRDFGDVWLALGLWMKKRDRPQPSLFDPPVYPATVA